MCLHTVYHDFTPLEKVTAYKVMMKTRTGWRGIYQGVTVTRKPNVTYKCRPMLIGYSTNRYKAGFHAYKNILTALDERYMMKRQGIEFLAVVEVELYNVHTAGHKFSDFTYVAEKMKIIKELIH